MTEDAYGAAPKILKGRVDAHLPSAYLLIISIVKGVVLGKGGLALAHYVAAAPRLDVDIIAAGMIGVTLAGVLVTYNGTLVGSVLASWPPSWVDTTLPLLIGLLEFVMFSITQIGTDRVVVEKWAVTFMIWAIAVAFLLWQVHYRVPKKLDGPVGQLYRWYAGTLRADRFGAETRKTDLFGVGVQFVLAAIIFVFAILTNEEWWPLRAVTLGVMFLLLIYANGRHETTRRALYELIRKLPLTRVNPWVSVPSEKDFIAPCDRDLIDAVLSSDPRARSELHFEVLPEPFAGDPDKATVFLLALNPAWGGTEEAEQGAVDDWDVELRRNLAFKATTPFVHIDPRFRETTGGGQWWTKRLRRLAEATSWECVGERVMVLEFFGYHSKTWQSLPVPLPSQAFTFQLLREAMDRNRLIIVTRGWSIWVWNIPELYSYKRIIRLNNQQYSGISPGNMPPDAFRQVVESLREGSR